MDCPICKHPAERNEYYEKIWECNVCSYSDRPFGWKSCNESELKFSRGSSAPCECKRADVPTITFTCSACSSRPRFKNGCQTAIIRFGKYKGKTLSDIFKEDKPYLQWISKQEWYRDKDIALYIITYT